MFKSGANIYKILFPKKTPSTAAAESFSFDEALEDDEDEEYMFAELNDEQIKWLANLTAMYGPLLKQYSPLL